EADYRCDVSQTGMFLRAVGGAVAGQLAPEPAARKRELRARLLAARRALPEPARREAARRVGEVLTGLLAAYAGRTIAGYVPMATEPGGPDLPDLLAAAVGESGRVLLPVLREDLDLAWAVAG